MKITKAQLKDIGIRTLKTAFAVAFVAFFSSLVFVKFTGFDEFNLTLYNATLTAGSAAATAVMNIIIKLVKGLFNDGKLTKEEIESAFDIDIEGGEGDA